MTRHIRHALGLAAVALALATTAQLAQAQGRGHDNGKGHGNGGHGKAGRGDRGDRGDAVIVRRSDGDVVVAPNNGRRVPPGLAKKPGQMPPGQYKKVYSTYQGASVLSDILRQRGYTVTRIAPYGQSQYVYYRANDGSIRRAIVSPGTDQLRFGNVAASIVQAVLSRLY